MNARKKALLCFTVGALAGGIYGITLLADRINDSPSSAAPAVRIDDTPIERDGAWRNSFAATVKKVRPSVVYVNTETKAAVPGIRRHFFPPDLPGFRFDFDPFGERERVVRNTGSGVVVSEDGYILTNNHVVASADGIEIVLADSDKSYPAVLVGADPLTDIAVLKIEAQELPAITLGDSDTLEMGDVVLAVGNPFGIGKTVTMGIVSAIGRGINDLRDDRYLDNFIQTDAAINPGNSGGALVDADGRLMGINTLIVSRSGGNNGIGFAVPINIARHVMNDLVADGKVRRGFLGVAIQDLSPDLAKHFHLENADGVLIGEVFADSPAERAGLKDGDVIVSLNDKAIKNLREFRAKIATSPDQTVGLVVVRDGQYLDIDASLGVRNESSSSSRPWNDNPVWRHDLLEDVTIENINDVHRRSLHIPRRIEGVLVTGIAPSSKAFRAGIREGDVIQSLDREPIDSVRNARELSRNADNRPLLLKIWRRGNSKYLMVDPD